jgi:hypothetical protein
VIIISRSRDELPVRESLATRASVTALARNRALCGPWCPFFLTCLSPNSLISWHRVRSGGGEKLGQRRCATCDREPMAVQTVVRRKGDDGA